MSKEIGNIESVEAKIRNLVSPMLNLVEAIRLGTGHFDDLIQFCNSSRNNIDRLIRLGEIVDKYLPDDFDINALLNMPNVRQKKIDRLNVLIDYCSEDEWNGPGSYALNKTAIDNVRTIIEIADEDVLDQFCLFPDLNGALLFTAKEKYNICNMSVGSHGISYLALREYKKQVYYKRL